MFITLSSPLLISFVHSLNQQLISNYWEYTLYHPTFKVLIFFSFLFFLSLQWPLAGILMTEGKLNETLLSSEYFIPIFPLFCLLLSACCSASPVCVHILFFLALGSISIFFLEQNWLLRVEHFIENFKFQSQKCWSGCFIGKKKNSPLFRPGSLRLLTWKLLKF